jgi:hypothetical protein
MFIMAGVATVVALLLPSVPREQILVFRVEDHVGIERLEASWARQDKQETLGGISLHFPDTAPRFIRHTLSVPNGAYVIDVRLHARDRAFSKERAGKAASPSDSVAGEAPGGVGSDVRDGPPTTTFVRRVNLEGGETVIRL